MSLTDLVVSGAIYKQDRTILLPGPLYFVFLAIELALFIMTLASYFTARSRANALQRSQANIVGLGILVAVIIALLCNAILPLVSGADFAKYGPVGTIFFVSFTAYAIIRHKLFDIRAALARSVGYVLSIATFSVIYVAFGFLVVGHLLLGSDNIPLDQQIAYTTMAVILALTFPAVKRSYDRFTERLFYQDAYDTQAFLNEFNKHLVTTYELDALLKKSMEITATYLKQSYTVFVIREYGKFRQVSSNAQGLTLTEADRAFLSKSIPKMRSNIVVTDMLDERHVELQHHLQKNNIAVVARLSSNKVDEGVGYLVLGPKKSGNPYSQQDISAIEIIANELVIAVQNALRFKEIENFAATLQERINEATRKLRRSNEKLRALDEAKDDFVSMASHQLRTPLTSVKGYISMVLEGDAGKINATQRKLLEQSFVSSQRMVYLIADLLNVSRLKTGKFIIEPTPVNIADIVEQEIGQLTETAAGRSLELTFEKPASFPTLMLDETKTRQVIMNFVDNAIYYTPAGGHIQVKLVETPTSVEFRVSDDGIGVPKSEQPHLFTKFYRAGNARKARPDGTGLGLFMAKKVIVAQGGAIVFETEEGKGSTFGFILPKATLAIPGSGR